VIVVSREPSRRNARRRLLRRARRWKLETQAFIKWDPFDEAFRAYTRQRDRLRKRDPELSDAVSRVTELDIDRILIMGLERWRDQGREEVRQQRNVRARGRRAYQRKWWSPRKRAVA